jgi:hypothetical protein
MRSFQKVFLENFHNGRGETLDRPGDLHYSSTCESAPEQP